MNRAPNYRTPLGLVNLIQSTGLQAAKPASSAAVVVFGSTSAPINLSIHKLTGITEECNVTRSISPIF
jgi:hypothetical protein